jgi:hypothetical protein
MIQFVKWLCFSLWSVLCAVLLGPWLTAWLQQYGLFDDPNQQITNLLGRLTELKVYFDKVSVSPWLIALLASTLGFYAGYLVKAKLTAIRGVNVSLGRITFGGQEDIDGAVRKPAPATDAGSEPMLRDFINVTPGYLIGLCRGLTAAQAEKLVESYKGKWLTATAHVGDVNVEPYYGYTLLQGATEDGARVSFTFAIANAGRLELLPPGHEVTVQGKITKIQAWGLSLDDCELVSDRSPVVLPVEKTGPQNDSAGEPGGGSPIPSASKT